MNYQKYFTFNWGEISKVYICETIKFHSIYSSKKLEKLGWKDHTKVRSKPYMKTQP